MNTKHTLFSLVVREHGIAACLGTPESAVTFLLLISEAITNGFWAETPE